MKNHIAIIIVVLAAMGFLGVGSVYLINHTAHLGPVITVPATLSVDEGRIVKLTAQTKDRSVKWYCASPNVDLIQFSGHEAYFCTNVPGTYMVMAYTASWNTPSDPACCIITVNPVNPTPPNPPNPPNPSDPFLLVLNNAFAQDSTANKAGQLAKLQSLWKNAASTTVNDPQIANISQLLGVMHSAATDLINNDLMVVRDTIRKELDTKLPVKASTTLDAPTRTLCAAQFSRIAELLTKVK